jgi:ankyrin repeat protein
MRISVLMGFLILLSFPGCHRGGGTVRHGSIIYNATEVFGDGTPALALAEAAGRGDVKAINRQIAAGADVNTVGRHENTPLWWAAFTENYEGFAASLDRGADPNAQRVEGYPVMYWIAGRKDPRFLKAALKHGGDPNFRDAHSGETPLFRPVMLGYQPQIDLLLAAGADVNARDPISGQTLPMVAIGARADYQLVYRLLQMGADPTAKTKGPRGGHTLVNFIEIRSVHASNNDDPWRAKVLEFLRSKGMTVKDPPKK